MKPSEASAARVDAADRARRRGKQPVDTSAERADAILAMPRPFEARTGEELVDVSRALGREPLPWELRLIEEARLRERAQARALFDGVGP